MGKPKHIALYNESDEDLWEQAEKVARQKHGASDATEGEVLGQIAAYFVGIDGPLEK